MADAAGKGAHGAGVLVEEMPSSEGILERVMVPESSAVVALASGRRVEIDSGEGMDRLTVRGRGGEVVLRVDLTEAGPVLRFDAAQVELHAEGKLELSGGEVALRSRGAIDIECAGDVRERIGGTRHARIAGHERLEAQRVELQANHEGVAIRAMERIALDGEHIGLNDDPAPVPFPWSATAERMAEDEDE